MRLSGPLSNRTIESGESRYHIRELIGGGGMGEVYRAIEENNYGAYLREVAIKLNKDITHPDRLNRFRREVQNLTKLHNPYNTRVYSYGEQRDHGNLIAQFMVMELLHGTTLEHQLNNSTFSSTWAIIVYRQIAKALIEAHDKGIIHRDLKPNNIILINSSDEPPFAKLCDFGLSKDAYGTPDSPISDSGQIIGTLWYMSPEQAKGEDLDQRSDIFSLGVILYQILTQHLPFPAKNLYHLYQLHPEGPCCDPLRDLSPSLQQLVLRSLAYQPDQRFSNLRECLTLLPSIDPSALSPTSQDSLPDHAVNLYTNHQYELPTHQDDFAVLASQPQITSSKIPSTQAQDLAIHPPLPTMSSKVIWALLLMITISGSLATFFIWRAHNSKLPNITAVPTTLNSNQPTSTKLRRLPNTANPNKTSDISTSPKPDTIHKRSTLPPDKDHVPADKATKLINTGKLNSANAKTTSDLTPKRSMTKHHKIRVSFQTEPSCEKLFIRHNSQYVQIRPPVYLKLGVYNFLCISPKIRLRRSITFRLLASDPNPIIQKRWRPVNVRLYIRPWAFLSVDAFNLPKCQDACIVQLWEGNSTFVLRRKIQGTSILKEVHRQNIVLSTEPNTPQKIHSFTIRWKPK
jgi:serine/threonine protein kinase